MRGISPIVAVVLLIAIAVIAATGLYFWMGGLATKQPTLNTPTAIAANVLSIEDGIVAVANLGSTNLTLSYLYTADGTTCNFSGEVTIPPGEQAVCTMPPKRGQSILYGPTTGQAIIEMPGSQIENVTFQTTTAFGTTAFSATSFAGGAFSDTQEGSIKLKGSTPSFAGSWPKFKYSNAGNAVTSETGPSSANQLWSFNTGGVVSSSPAMVGGVVYVGSDDFKVYAINATDGSEIWNYTTGAEVKSSPAVTNGIVYVGSNDLHLYALNASTAAMSDEERQLWNYTNAAAITSSPLVFGGVVYYGDANWAVIALDADDGSEIWWNDTANIPVSSPAYYDGMIFIGDDSGYVYAFDAASGDQLWNYTTGGAVKSSPAVVDGVVYVGSYDNKLYALYTNSTLKWVTVAMAHDVYSSPVVSNGRVIVGTIGTTGGGCFPGDTLISVMPGVSAPMQSLSIGQYILSPEGPVQVLAKHETVRDGYYSITAGGFSVNATAEHPFLTASGYKEARNLVPGDILVTIGGEHELTSIEYINSPTTVYNLAVGGSHEFYANGFVVHNKATIYAYNATDGSWLWTYNVATYSSPAVDAAGNIYIGYSAGLVSLYPNNGSQRWLYGGFGAMQSSPAIVGNVAYIGTSGGEVHAIGGYATSGTYESAVLDSGNNDTNWTDFTWDNVTLADTTVTVSTAVYDDFNPGWTPRSKGDDIGVGRYFAYYVELATANKGQTPQVNSVSVDYANAAAPLTYTVNAETALSWVALEQDCDGVVDSDYYNESASGTFYSHSLIVDASCSYKTWGPGITNSTYPS